MSDDLAPPAGFVPTGNVAGFHSAVGPFLVSPAGPPWRMGFRVLDRHTNPHGLADGGMLMTLTDHLIGITIFRTVERGTQAVTISLNGDFLGPGRRGDWVEGKAVITRKTRDLIFARAEIYCERNPIMAASGVWKIVPNRRVVAGSATPGELAEEFR
ncbi:MAG: PaaI family thioesterase [Alphaproteobacteria bacterium]|nr:PaaI family thioesterase [Alphaproteobacteria bacterium]